MDTQAAPSKLKTWKTFLSGEKEQPYFQKALQYVQQRRAAGIAVYPPASDVFNAFKYTSFEKVSVVILGQDPYHGPGQAHGLSFSVPRNKPFPPSLQNIFKELRRDVGTPYPTSGCLESWAQQGVLLLNTTLTVEEGKPQSHAEIGWSIFTDKVISILNEEKEGLIFLLWGAYAQRKAAMIDPIRHHILMAPHPSPLSAHRGFLGCGHFSKTNELLAKQGLPPISW